MKPDLLLSADWHIRPDIPKCRTDDFIDSMFKDIKFVRELANKYNIPTIIAGDIGQAPIKGWPPWIIGRMISELDYFHKGIYVIAGQHDLPEHNIDRLSESGLGVLCDAGVVSLLKNSVLTAIGNVDVVGFSYGQGICNIDNIWDEVSVKVAVMHSMVIQDKKLWPGQKVYNARHYLRKYNYDLIVCGDNHQPFVEYYKGRLLVNCGSLMRQRSDQVDHRPRVYLYYAEDNTVDPVYLPYNHDDVSIEIRQKEVMRDERMQKFVESIETPYEAGIETPYEAGLKFEDNLHEQLEVNSVSESVKRKIWRSYEGHGGAGRKAT